MREINFRIWYNDNTMEYSADNWFIDLSGDLFCMDTDNGRLQKCRRSFNYELMQYTGLKDKNGKEIFEGDIVKHTFQQTVPVNGSFNAPVFFYEGGFAIGIINSEPLTLREAIKISNKADGLEVIGNIYQNKYLFENNA
jgi:uncharacterized phage protein (TIGR01671 family)